MHCDDLLERVADLLEPEATALSVAAALPREAQRHLEACPACRRALHELVALERALPAALADAPVPAGLVARVLERAGEPLDEALLAPLPAPREGGWLVPAALSAAVVLLTLALLPYVPPLELPDPSGWLDALGVSGTSWVAAAAAGTGLAVLNLREATHA